MQKMASHAAQVIRWAARPESIGAVAAVCLVTLKLHTPTYIGIADNSDYWRLMQPLGVDYHVADPALRYDYFVNRYYTFVPRGPIPYPSSALAILWPAVIASRLLGAQLFDLAVAGYLYALTFALGVFLVIRGVRRLAPSRWLVWAAVFVLLVMFTDTAYVAYFHSFYSEPASYVFLFLMLGALLNLVADDRPNYPLLGVFAASCAALLTAKTQNLPMVILVAIFSVRLVTLHRERRWRASVGLSCLLALVAVSVAFARAPADNRQVNIYQGVFLGILHGEIRADAQRDLQSLGVDTRYANLVDQPYYGRVGQQAQQDPRFVANFYGHVSQGTIVGFYLTHPTRLAPAFSLSADAALTMRPDYLGNFLKQQGTPRGALSYRMDVWSALKANVLPRSPWLLLAFFALYFVALVRAHRAAPDARRGTLVELAGFIGALALLQFALTYVADGAYELVKHLYLYDALFDLTLAIAILWLAYRLATIVARRRSHAGSAVGDAAQRELVPQDARVIV